MPSVLPRCSPLYFCDDVVAFSAAKTANKRTRWKTTASPGVNWRFEVRQDRYVPATARRFLFSPVARNGFQELNHYRWLWHGISILSRFSLFHALSERCQNRCLFQGIIASWEIEKIVKDNQIIVNVQLSHKYKAFLIYSLKNTGGNKRQRKTNIIY